MSTRQKVNLSSMIFSFLIRAIKNFKFDYDGYKLKFQAIHKLVSELFCNTNTQLLLCSLFLISSGRKSIFSCDALITKSMFLSFAFGILASSHLVFTNVCENVFAYSLHIFNSGSPMSTFSSNLIS